MKEDKELQQFRSLLEPPSVFEDGFSLRSVIGCIFIGLVMMPASMYLALLVGGGLSDTARWVTVILFVELARRSFTTLRAPEIYVLFYMTSAMVASPFSGLLWTQYYVQSPPVLHTFSDKIPSWIAPGRDVLALRTFFHPAWLGPIAMIVLGQLLGRIDRFGLGYVLFRITSDVEKLPFPMAPVGALGVYALAESAENPSSPAANTGNWKWRVFSIGAMIGLVFGAVYVALPALSSTFLKSTLSPIKIPYSDFTTTTETFLPATPFAVSFDLGNLFVGMVLPFFAVLGSFIGLVISFIVNPILHATGQLPSWRPGMNATDTAFANSVDAYLSIGIGLSLAIALVGFFHVFISLRRKKTSAGPGEQPQDSPWHRLLHPPPGRGDIPIWAGLAIYLFSTTTYIVLCHYLVPTFPLWILLAYGFVYTPIISYVAARMEGVAGQWVELPFVRESTFVAAQSLGYRGIDIWFAPIPLNNYAGTVLEFRQQELTGTKFTSLIKAELILFPLVIIASILFSQYLWRIASIPSAVYPYANQMWEYQAKQQALVQSSTLGEPGAGGSLSGTQNFYAAVKWKYIAGATTAGVVVYSLLSTLGAPVLLCYGLVRGLAGGLVYSLIPQMIGALLSRYYFEKRFGLKWRQYAPVLLAGFSCGVGLTSMLSLGCLLISKAVFQLPY